MGKHRTAPGQDASTACGPQEDRPGRAVQVRCYSGHNYAGRPQSFTWQGEEAAVEEILSQWREPAGPAFRVRTGQGDFTLAYEERSDRWWLREG